jgi:hypothetical protein
MPPWQPPALSTLTARRFVAVFVQVSGTESAPSTGSGAAPVRLIHLVQYADSYLTEG